MAFFHGRLYNIQKEKIFEMKRRQAVYPLSPCSLQRKPPLSLLILSLLSLLLLSTSMFRLCTRNVFALELVVARIVCIL